MTNESPTSVTYESREGKLWELPGFLVERLENGALRITVGGAITFALAADVAESLLQWMDRSR